MACIHQRGVSAYQRGRRCSSRPRLEGRRRRYERRANCCPANSRGKTPIDREELTAGGPHDLDAFLGLLKLDGTLTLVGAPARPHPSPGVFNLIMKRRRLAGSLIGGIRETQEMLDFCAEHGIVSDIESIRMDEIETAFDRMLKSDVKYRVVVDMATLKATA